MVNIKLIGLLAIFLIIVSGSFLLDASALTQKNNEGLTYTTLANDLPWSSDTPTPSPTPTPVPTITPTPTPRPEPTARPIMTIDCISAASANNPKVQVSGTLTYNKTAIQGANIYVGFSADAGNKWENFTLVQTRADGSFGTLWIPNATGNYLVTANWEGNLTLHWMNATANLVLIPDGSGNELSVVSNSTITSFSYNAAAQELSFNTNGTQSTTGYARVCIPKSLISDINTVQLKIDGKSATFTSTSQDDVWVISCVYTQSEHAFTLQIPFLQTIGPETTPWLTIIIVIVIVIALLGIVLAIRRRRRTAATVAAILKEDRPKY